MGQDRLAADAVSRGIEIGGEIPAADSHGNHIQRQILQRINLSGLEFVGAEKVASEKRIESRLGHLLRGFAWDAVGGEERAERFAAKVSCKPRSIR